ncbi:MAG: arginase family protein [Candidatus Nanopelagicales bacterium]
MHDREHVESVVLDGRSGEWSGEWSGERPDLGRLAVRMAGGTLLALAAVLAASRMRAGEYGGRVHRIPLRVVILDIDAHHGDGTEALTRGHETILAFSIHDESIFPGTGRDHDPGHHAYNRALAIGSGDDELDAGIDEFSTLAEPFGPDVVMIAAGADGLAGDPLSMLRYRTGGLVDAVRRVRGLFPDVPNLLGGAGGYRPDDLTPEAWACMALAAAQPVEPRSRVFP